MKLALIIGATGLVPVASIALTQANGLAIALIGAWLALGAYLIAKDI